MEVATEIFAAVFSLVIGLSHILQPRGWVEFFVWLRSKGNAGVFVNGPDEFAPQSRQGNDRRSSHSRCNLVAQRFQRNS